MTQSHINNSKLTIYIWGTGRLVGKVLGVYLTIDQVAGFIDNNHNIKEYMGKPVYTPEQAAKLDYDAIIVENMTGLANAIINEAEKKSSRSRYFFHIHNNIDMYRSPAEIKSLKDKGVCFISVSKYIENEIRRSVPNACVSVLYNGVDKKLMNREHKNNRSELRKRYDVPETATVILYSGRIIAEKGVYELVHAFNKYITKCPDSKLFLVLAGGGIGEGGKRTRYEKKVLLELDKVHENTRLLGWIPYDRISEIYAMADALVVPTLTEEPFGMVVLEGMAMGLPIITTANGGIPEVLEDEEGSLKLSVEKMTEELVGIFKQADEEKYRNKLTQMGNHNLEIFLKKEDAGKEDYFDRFLSVIGLNTEGKY